MIMSTPPLILTAHTNEDDILFFDELRSRFFPPERNFLRAHVTMFHKLPLQYLEDIVEIIASLATLTNKMEARVTGVRHLGSGVAFDLQSDALMTARQKLKDAFRPWLGAQDHQPWKPHITVQNKVHWQKADALFDMLSNSFVPTTIMIEGFDLWSYMQGPWRHEQLFKFSKAGD